MMVIIKKLLLSFTSFFMIWGTATTVAYNEELLNSQNNENNIQTKSQRDKEISISEWKLKETTIDLSIYDEDTNEEDIKWDVFLTVATENSEIPNLEDVIFDILINEDNWKITGLDYKIPEPGKEKLYNVKIAALPDNAQYSGILKAPIRYINSTEVIVPEIKLLSDDVTTTELGELTNPTKASLDALVRSENDLIKMDEIEIDDYDYFSITYRVKPNSTYYYQGTETFYYESNIQFQIEPFNSSLLEVEAYNSTQTKSKTKTYYYEPEFGIAKFIKKYNRLTVFHSGGGYISNQSGNIPKVLDGSSILDLQTGEQVLLADDYYGTVNWNLFSIKSSISFYNDEKISITFSLNAQAYASWMNAYYSRAGVELNVTQLLFS